MDFKLPELGEGVYEAELVAWLVQPGQTVKRGQSLMEVLTVKAAPSVRYLARKLGIDLQHVGGSGPEGRILIDDLTAHVQAASALAKPHAEQQNYGTPGTRIKLQGLRRKIAERMVQSKHSIP